jgi:hypothetical protein
MNMGPFYTVLLSATAATLLLKLWKSGGGR